MDDKLFQILMAVVSVLGGAWLKAIWDGLKEQREAGRSLEDKVNALSNLVAGSYVHRDEFIRWTDSLSAKIDRNQEIIGGKLDLIANKLDRKVDKEDCDSCPSGRWTGLERRGS